MLIKIKKNGFLIYKKFRFKCIFGKLGIKKNKKEGDKATPEGIFTLGKIYYRADRVDKIDTQLKCKVIKKYMGWCNNPNDVKYNREFNLNSKKKGEKLFRKDHKYDVFIPINYNTNPIIPRRGSVIFLHLTQNYKPTAGCVAISVKDFLSLVKHIKSTTKIKIG
jgi:L,D-peptidoglycan transpeptidase YkuD (ErfK/YbiS/YcfS/YnhG family)